jgi:hypothetical protein
MQGCAYAWYEFGYSLLAAYAPCPGSTRVSKLRTKRLEARLEAVARRPVAVDPITLYHNLLSPSSEERKQAYGHLGFAFSDASRPVDARLDAVNLDADDDLEYILTASGSPARTMAIVFDKVGDIWWIVGEFSYWWHWNANDAERLIELREIVWPGRKEIIVREQGGGTGVADPTLADGT